MHDPVIADLNRYLDEIDKLEAREEYFMEHGQYPIPENCSMFPEHCLSCKKQRCDG